MVTEPMDLLALLARVLGASGLRYAVGGSIASSLHGEYRATNDIDVVIEVGPRTIGDLLSALGDGFHVDAAAAELAARSGGTFTAIHLEGMVKIDFFVATEEKIHRLQLERRRPVSLDTAGPPLYVVSPEDTILVKLLWHRRSEHVLERQLRDVVGILKTRPGDLDRAYLTHAATDLGIRDLLDGAIADAGLDTVE